MQNEVVARHEAIQGSKLCSLDCFVHRNAALFEIVSICLLQPVKTKWKLYSCTHSCSSDDNHLRNGITSMPMLKSICIVEVEAELDQIDLEAKECPVLQKRSDYSDRFCVVLQRESLHIRPNHRFIPD